ncbi:hypothetical protein BSNK01_24340 [Bacillaceae bacterium]
MDKNRQKCANCRMPLVQYEVRKFKNVCIDCSDEKEKYAHTVGYSFVNLYRIYQPENLNKFVKQFMNKYKIPKGYEEQLKRLI